MVTNNPKAGVIEVAENAGIEVWIISKVELALPSFSEKLVSKNIKLIVLAGFLALVPRHLLKHFPRRIINIHPALLPKHGGKGMYGIHVHRAVVEAGDMETGITIHEVNENYDEGSILLQKTCPVNKRMTPEEVAAAVQQLEHKYYPKFIESRLEKL